MATTATAIATKPLRTRVELAGGDAPPVYRPRISAIKVIERRLATYFRSQIRSARTALSALDGDDLSDLSSKQIDKLLEKLVGKVKASENSERLLRRALMGIYEGMAEASHRRSLKQVRSAARKLKQAGKTIRKAQPLELSKQLINATEWARMHAGELITDTDDVTKSWVMRAIRKGIEEGQSIQQMEDRLIWIRGSWTQRQPGKQSRAEKIARTETGMAYNMGSLIGYRDSEVVEFVNVYDNKAPGSCAACAEADGQVWTVSYAMDHLLQHPNCLRSFGAAIDVEPEPGVAEPKPDEGVPITRERRGGTLPTANEYRTIGKRTSNWLLEGEKAPDTPTDAYFLMEDIAPERKEEIATRIAARAGRPYEQVNRVIEQWAHSSNKEGGSIRIQSAVSEEFGVPLSLWQKSLLESNREEVVNIGRMIKRALAEKEADPELSIEGYLADLRKRRDMANGASVTNRPWHDNSEIRSILRAMYDNTQQALEEAGLEEVVLRRGVKLRTDVIDLKTYDAVELVETNAISSWSTMRKMAVPFAQGPSAAQKGYIFETTFPASRILGTCRTGFGCSAEFEFVVLGSQAGIADQAIVARTFTLRRP